MSACVPEILTTPGQAPTAHSLPSASYTYIVGPGRRGWSGLRGPSHQALSTAHNAPCQQDLGAMLTGQMATRWGLRGPRVIWSKTTNATPEWTGTAGGWGGPEVTSSRKGDPLLTNPPAPCNECAITFSNL